MADISQAAASVAISGNKGQTRTVQYGEAVTQGMPLYQNTTDSKWYQCDANDGLAKARCGAIALTAGAADGYGLVALPANTDGVSLVNLGATLATGTAYAVSATKGAIAPVADISSTQFVTIIGVAISAALLDFQVTVCSVAKA
jgi:hypothetical protein